MIRVELRWCLATTGICRRCRRPLRWEDANEAVDASPELVNQAAFSEGWLLKVRLADKSQTESLMKSDEYVSII